MNKRIEDLMYHAGLTAAGCWDTMDAYDRAAIEKFAELIVRECAVMTKGYEFALGHKDELSKTMREHFGVEE